MKLYKYLKINHGCKNEHCLCPTNDTNARRVPIEFNYRRV